MTTPVMLTQEAASEMASTLDLIRRRVFAETRDQMAALAIIEIRGQIINALQLAHDGNVGLCLRCSADMFGSWCVHCGWQDDAGLAPVVALTQPHRPANPAAPGMAIAG